MAPNDTSSEASHPRFNQTFREIEVAPMSHALGAEILAPALFEPVRDEADKVRRRVAADEVHRAWLNYHLVVFRDVEFTPQALAEFCELFGELDTYPFVQATAEHPNVIPIIKEADDRENFGGAWHTDTSYMDKPPKATCLYAVEVPSAGGDTLFANTGRAFDELSMGLKAMLADVFGIYTSQLVHGASGPYASVKSGRAAKAAPDTMRSSVRHPIIRTHPETGRQSIYATPLHCESFENMSRDETLPVLNYLYEFATQEKFQARLKWRKGTLAMWDNRSLFHNALNDYQGERREMLRVTLKGEAPV